MDIAGKVAVVTGAAQGIGAALARLMMAEQAKAVVVADISMEEARKVANEIDGLAFECDVSKEEDISRLVEFVDDKLGQIDLFCSNAGILGPTGGIEASSEQWERVMSINFMAHVNAARSVLPGMCQRGEGYLLQIASAAGISSHVGSAPYSVSKHAALAWAEWLAITYRPQGIGVSCVCPLGVRTEMLEQDTFLSPAIGASSVSAEEVATVSIEGVKNDQFLILPHEEILRHLERKGRDYDRWIRNMSHLKTSLEPDEAND